MLFKNKAKIKINLIIDLNINQEDKKPIIKRIKLFKIYFLKQTASTIQLNSLVPLNSLN